MPTKAIPHRQKSRQTAFVLDSRSTRAKQFSGRLGAKMIATIKDVQASVDAAASDSLWVSYVPRLTNELLKSVSRPSSRLGFGVLVHELKSQSLPMLTSSFRGVAYGTPSSFLPPVELAEVLSAENREDLFISGTVDSSTCTITFSRGNLNSLVVPFYAFQPSGNGVAPNFSDFSITDYGQTVRLGDYEAAVDAILYEYDSDYRRRLKRQRRASERTFAASLRRLRLQKKVSRSDFPGISEKTIARIEQGETGKQNIRPRTLSLVAERLGVESREIGSF